MEQRPFPIDPSLPPLLRSASHVVVFTGAGVSAESGIPTFRDALTGLWERFDAEALATPRAFRDDPDLVWGWYESRRRAVLATRPNAGHRAIAAIERAVPRFTLVTQNIDNLHERAGSSDPIHLHGSLFSPRCFGCARPAALDEDQGPEPAGLDDSQGPPSQGPVIVEGRILPPRCDSCGDFIRPGVVWFGEVLPSEAIATADRAASHCDLLISVGTSGMVYPAADIPRIAGRHGATLVQVNPNESLMDDVFDMNLRGLATLVLPALVAASWPSVPPTPGA